MRCGGTVWAEDLVSIGVQLALEAEVAQGAVSRTALLYHVHLRRRQYEVVKKRRKAIDECAWWWSTVRHSSIRNRDEPTSSGSVALEEEVIHRPGVMCWGFKVLGYLATSATSGLVVPHHGQAFAARISGRGPRLPTLLVAWRVI